MIKIHIQYSEKFQGNSVFQGKRKFLKNPEQKIYIQDCEFRANSVFQGKRKFLKNSEYKKYIQLSKQACYIQIQLSKGVSW